MCILLSKYLDSDYFPIKIILVFARPLHLALYLCTSFPPLIQSKVFRGEFQNSHLRQCFVLSHGQTQDKTCLFYRLVINKINSAANHLTTSCCCRNDLHNFLGSSRQNCRSKVLCWFKPGIMISSSRKSRAVPTSQLTSRTPASCSMLPRSDQMVVATWWRVGSACNDQDGH